MALANAILTHIFQSHLAGVRCLNWCIGRALAFKTIGRGFDKLRVTSTCEKEKALARREPATCGFERQRQPFFFKRRRRIRLLAEAYDLPLHTLHIGGRGVSEKSPP